MGLIANRIWLLAAALWGFAEATLFFVVPDVLLTLSVVMLGVFGALRLATAAAFAAALGGALMFWWGMSDVDAARAALLSVPLIGGDLLTRVQGEIQGPWVWNLTFGAVTGAPYKIYAVEAGAAQINGVSFFIVSFAARLARFLLAIGLTAAGVALARRFGAMRFAAFGVVAVWAAIYIAYIYVRLQAT